LIAAGHEVRALVRQGSEDRLASRDSVDAIHGDVTDADSLHGALEGCDAVIHLVGIIREFPAKGITFEKLHVDATQNILNACRQQGVMRYLHMSANGTRKDGSTLYHKTKWQAEELVRSSELEWTIFRPSLIFGPDGEFVAMLSELIRRIPVVPVIGDGQYRMQPVAVDQVAESFVGALQLPDTIGETYHLGGSADYTYDEILDLTSEAMGKGPVSKVHQPLFMIKPMIKLLDGFEKFPITEDQLKMLVEGNVCDPDNWAKTFAIDPVSYAEGIKDCF
jgi:NADH dehydrogenase